MVGGAKPGALRPETDEAGRADEKAAALVGVGRTTVATAKAIRRRDEDGEGEVVQRMRAGELNGAQAAREVGGDPWPAAAPGMVAIGSAPWRARIRGRGARSPAFFVPSSLGNTLLERANVCSPARQVERNYPCRAALATRPTMRSTSRID
jgi:hypothetical protein